MILEQQLTIAGVEYEVCGEIGEGGVGHVYIIKTATKRYALKVIREYSRNPITKQMVNQQIKTQKMFAGNPYIIQIIEHEYLPFHSENRTE